MGDVKLDDEMKSLNLSFPLIIVIILQSLILMFFIVIISLTFLRIEGYAGPIAGGMIVRISYMGLALFWLYVIIGLSRYNESSRLIMVFMNGLMTMLSIFVIQEVFAFAIFMGIFGTTFVILQFHTPTKLKFIYKKEWEMRRKPLEVPSFLG
jgi:hypothetical protein